MQKIILASQSPRRKQLLEWAEVPFDIIVSDSDETYPSHLTFEETAIHIARNKALAVSEKSGTNMPILAADTIVVCNNEILGKPTDRNNAIEILGKLSGTKHNVITGVTIIANNQEMSFADITKVEFHTLTADQIEFYVDKYKPYDKAGAYAIQEWIGVTGIRSISGDFYNVMGLPVSRVVQELRLL
ncbi:MAG: septum formation protein Maf [Bacteroidetes bacterium]|nr:septum formation protein Maf [Bacteroidota bacterium]